MAEAISQNSLDDFFNAKRQRWATDSLAVVQPDDDPERAARALELGKATGVPAESILPNLDNFENEHKTLLASDLVANNPHLQSYLNHDSMAPKLSHDDIGNLDAMSQAIDKYMAKQKDNWFQTWLKSNSIQKAAEQGWGDRPLGMMHGEPDPNQRFMSAIGATLATPIELPQRILGAGVAATEQLAKDFFGDQAAEVFARGAQVAFDPATAMLFPHPTFNHMLKTRMEAEMAKPLRDAVNIADVYHRSGVDAPPGLHPEIDKIKAATANEDAGLMDDVIKAAQQSATRERNPEYFVKFLEGPFGNSKIAIDANAIARLYGDKPPTADDGVLGWIPNLADRLAAVAGSNGFIEVPAKEFAARVDPEVYKEIRDDILFRQNGLTLNEVKEAGKSEASKENEGQGPIDNPRSVVRAGAGLEPLFSVGDRKVTLQRMKQKPSNLTGPDTGIEQGFHDFDILDQDGKKVGAINLSEQKGGKQLYIEMIQAGADKRMYDPNFLGPALIRDIGRQLKKEFPNAFGPDGLGITGHRVSGAREKAGTWEQPSAMPVVKFDRGPGDIKRFRDLLNAHWEDVGSGVEALFQTDEKGLAADSPLGRMVIEEMRRLSPDTPIDVAHGIALEGRELQGVYLPFTREVITSLMADDPIGTTRHEAVHALKRLQMFTEDEWRTLESAVLENKWMEQYNISRRYPDLHPGARIEEAIAEAFGHWRNGEAMPTGVHAIFEKIKSFFEGLLKRVGDHLGLRADSWEDIFKKIDSGEVGNRLPERPELKGYDADAIEKETGIRMQRPNEPPSLPPEGSAPDELPIPLPFGDHRSIGVPKAMYERYMRLIRRKHADDLKTDFGAEYERERKEQTREWRENRATMREQVEAEINDKPDIVLDRFFSERGGQYKIDPMSISEDLREALPRDYTRRVDSFAADDLAGFFGYPSGDALVAHLAQVAKDRLEKNLSHKDYVRSLIDAETDRRMEAQFGWLEKNILEEAKDAALSENQINILHEETQFLAQKAGATEAPLSRAALEATLREGFMETPIDAISSDSWLRVAGKAGRKTEEALLKGDFQEALKQKQAQTNAVTQAKWAREYERERSKFDKLAKRYRRPPTKDTAKKIETHWYDFIQQLLDRTGNPVRRADDALASSIEKSGYANFREFVNSELAMLSELKVADWLQDESLKRTMESLSYAEFKDLHDAIATMHFVGRDKKKIMLAGEARELDEVIGNLLNQLNEALPIEGTREATPRSNLAVDAGKAFLWSHISAETMWNRLDRGDKRGLLNQLLSYPAAQAGNYRSKLLKDFSEEIAKIGKIPDMDKLVENSLWIDPYIGQPMIMRKRNVLGIIQNWGNRSNRTKLLEGWGVSEEDALAWLKEHSKPEDWERAQAIGDIYKRIHAMADNMSYNVSGVGIDPLPIEGVETPHGQTLAGWYNPVKYDPVRPGKSKRILGEGDIEREGYFRATTPQGYTKKRTHYIAPVELNLDVVPIRMKQMLHDIAMRPAINEMAKIIYDSRFQRAVIAHYGRFPMAEMKSYLKDIANSSNFMSDTEHVTSQVLEIIRRNTVATLIGLNPSTVMKHTPTAAMNSVTEVGAANLMKEFATLRATDPATFKRNSEMAYEKSEEIQRRMQNWEEVIRQSDPEISFTGGGLAKARDIMSHIGSYPVAFGDFMSAVPTWLAEYKQQIAAGADEGMAVTLADRAVRRAHGSSAITARPSISRSTSVIGKTYASLYGFFSHMLQKQYELAWMSRDLLNGKKPLDEAYVGRAFSSAAARILVGGLISYVLFPAIVEELVTPYQKSEKDNWGVKAAKTLAFGTSSSLIGVRDAVRSLINTNEPQLGLLGTSVGSIGQLYRDLGKPHPFSREHAGDMIKHAFTLTGVLTGLTNSQEGRIVQYLQRYASGLERPKGPWDVAVGLRYGKTEHHSHTFEEWWKHTIQGRK